MTGALREARKNHAVDPRAYRCPVEEQRGGRASSKGSDPTSSRTNLPELVFARELRHGRAPFTERRAPLDVRNIGILCSNRSLVAL